MLITEKKVRVNIPKKEHPFVMKTLFVYRAKEQGWTDSEIQKLLKDLDRQNSKEVWRVLNIYCEKK